MTAIAPHPFGIAEEQPRFAASPARLASAELDRPNGVIPGAVASPWRSPLFYLAFVAAALLFVAVGVILMWRIMMRPRRS
ncbi:hypothetical protein EQZ23_10715 [Sphingomonas sp. UV9]|uniref:hypothetical protein n=1 Tax=Sphingomonas sp. UV9 TaxID=1851410 RepID=UPI000FFC0665|nr:hypothetical protein [Sphingomonas sp. UV9]RXD05524.1 hypothetical protein EQZ23_10715 [Sphingomonas sp. UV9]